MQEKQLLKIIVLFRFFYEYNKKPIQIEVSNRFAWLLFSKNHQMVTIRDYLNKQKFLYLMREVRSKFSVFNVEYFEKFIN